MEENYIVDESRVTKEGEEKVCPEIIPTSVDLGDDLLESTDVQFNELTYILIQVTIQNS